MTMWADNIKFVKDIIDGKYQKIDAAAHEVGPWKKWSDDDQITKFLISDEWECRCSPEGSSLPEV